MERDRTTDQPPLAIVLAGGLGTRLRSIYPDCAKTMVPVLGRPFIEYVVRQLAGQGIGDIIISTGYKGDQIESYFRSVAVPTQLRCVREETQLGTGGALAFVLSKVASSEWILAANGDSLVSFSLCRMMKRARSCADAVLIGVHVPEANRFGSLTLDAHGMLAGFHEKAQRSSPGLINGGIYLLKRSLLPAAPPRKPESLESDYLPRWLQQGARIAVLQSHDPFIDIGTPESLAEAARFVEGSGLLPAMACGQDGCLLEADDRPKWHLDQSSDGKTTGAFSK